MKKNFRTAVAMGTLTCGIAVPFACCSQTAVAGADQAASSPRADSAAAAAEPQLRASTPGAQPANAIGVLAADAPLPDAPGSGQAAAAQAPATASAAPSAGVAPSKPKLGFFTRWGRAYATDWAGTTPVGPNAPQRRGTPPPIPAPPYPASDWPIDGTQLIGAPDYQSY